MIRAEALNPFGLDWSRFLVAEREGQVVGIGQIKPHGDGSRELASIAVIPTAQGQGVGTHLIHALMAAERGPLYLMCRPELEGYYQRFGFTSVEDRRAMPPYFRRIARIAAVILPLVRRFVRDAHGPSIMYRAPDTLDAQAALRG
jgi:N-acetylglutamate synthase-like GNAT family acetyltransferase